MLATEPAESMLASEANGPIDRIDPLEPMDAIEPRELTGEIVSLLEAIGPLCRNGFGTWPGLPGVSRALTISARLPGARGGPIAWDSRRRTGARATVRSAKRG